MRPATVSIAAGFVLAAACACSATDVHWVPAYYLAPQDHSGGQITSGDLDGDGDIDLSFGSRHYWNVGTAQVPEWELDWTVYGAIPECNGRGMALGDIDSDGDLDLVVTCQYSYEEDKLQLFGNVGSCEIPMWEKVDGAFAAIPEYLGPLEPSLVDIDADGDLDLLILNENGCLILIENTGSPSTPVWSDAGYSCGLPRNGAADLGDLDGDGDLDLVVISEESPPVCWENVGTPQSFEFVENPSMLLGVSGPELGWGTELLDIDGDSDLDLLISGGLVASGDYLYLNEQIVPVEKSSWTSIKALYR